MARIRREVTVGCPRRITHGVNFRCDLFLDDEGRKPCLSLLDGLATDRHPRLLGEGLITNHIHPIAVPVCPDSLCLSMRDTPRDVFRLLNTRLQCCSPCWENRCFSCPQTRIACEKRAVPAGHKRERTLSRNWKRSRNGISSRKSPAPSRKPRPPLPPPTTPQNLDCQRIACPMCRAMDHLISSFQKDA